MWWSRVRRLTSTSVLKPLHCWMGQPWEHNSPCPLHHFPRYRTCSQACGHVKDWNSPSWRFLMNLWVPGSTATLLHLVCMLQYPSFPRYVSPAYCSLSECSLGLAWPSPGVVCRAYQAWNPCSGQPGKAIGFVTNPCSLSQPQMTGPCHIAQVQDYDRGAPTPFEHQTRGT